MIRIVFLRHASISAALLRAVTWSAWSHVALANDEDDVIESTALGGGVRGTTMALLLRNASSYEIGTVDCDGAAAWAFALRQIGKPYDWTAVLGIGLHRDWQDDDKWFCSELAAASVAAAGIDLVRKTKNRITPQDLYQSPLVRITKKG